MISSHTKVLHSNLISLSRHDSTVHLGKKNLIQVENGKFFINSRIFDEISGKEIPNKFRRFETLVAEMFIGQNLNPNEFIRKIPVKGHKSTPIFLAAKVAMLLVLRGLKTSLGIHAENSLLSSFSIKMLYRT